MNSNKKEAEAWYFRLWLEYNPQVKSYSRGDIGTSFATTYRLPTPKNAPFSIGYTFEGKPHDYLPDVVGTLTNGKLFIAEAGTEDDKPGDRNLAKAEAACRLARIQRGVFWIGTECTLTRQCHYNLVFLHARRQGFSAFADIALAVQEVWPWEKVASIEEVESHLAQRWPTPLTNKCVQKCLDSRVSRIWWPCANGLITNLSIHELRKNEQRMCSRLASRAITADVNWDIRIVG